MSPLPPLPEPAIASYQTDSTMRRSFLLSFSEDQMRSYAESARAQVLEVLRDYLAAETAGDEPIHEYYRRLDAVRERARSLINPDQATGSDR